jgi:hypothetical protein
MSKALGGMFNAILPGVGALLGPLLGKIGGAIAGLFNRDQGRDAVKEWAQGITGSSDLNALHAFLSKELPGEAEKFWIALTQGAAHGNPETAHKVIDEVTAALEKHKTAQQEVEQAAKDAGVAETEAYKSAKSAVDSLDSQIKTLSDSIAGEAPEEFMGIVEQQTRERIKGLTQERDAAQQTLEGLTVTMTDSIDRVAKAIEDLPKSIELSFSANGKGWNPATSEVPEGFAMGGTVLGFASGGRVPRGTDTVPIMATPGEIILNAAQQRRVASGLADGRLHAEIQGLRADLSAIQDQARADRIYLLSQMPKAILAAYQKAAA